MAKTEQEKAKAREYYLRNKDAILAKQKMRRDARTPEQVLADKIKEKEKNAANYAKHRERILGYKRKYREKNRSEMNAKKRESRRAATEKPYDHLKKYGITREDYLRMLAQQGGVCAICHQPDSIRLAVDHCHNTGIVRGLLCARCNTSIGKFNDDVSLLRKAIDYLEKHHGNITNPAITESYEGAGILVSNN